MPSVIVKPRAGNRSAQLVMSVMNKRVNRRLPTSIGSVRHGASLETGEGFTFKKGFSLEGLTKEDRAKIAAWLATSGKPDVAKPTLGTVSEKLDRVLDLLSRAPTRNVSETAAPVSDVAESGQPHAMDRLERTFEDALAELATQVEALKQAGVKLSKKTHTLSVPHTAGNQLDELQAWTNRFRNELVPKFQRTCQALGLWKLGSSGDTQ